MAALRRFNKRFKYPSLLQPATNIKTFTANKQCKHISTQQEKHENDDITRPHVALAASATLAAASLTPAGYAISPIGVTVLSNLPLAAFAFVQASGLSPIKQILKDKATGDLSPFPFISLYTNCAIWSLYGVLQSDTTVLVANLAGVVAGVAYTGIFAKYTHQSMSKFYLGSGAILGTFLSSPLWASSVGTDAATILGTFGMSTAVILMASPLATIGTVIKQKSTASMPFVVSLAMTLNGLAWGSYGWFVTNDFYVYVPNIMGVAAGVIQLSVFAVYS